MSLEPSTHDGGELCGPHWSEQPPVMALLRHAYSFGAQPSFRKGAIGALQEERMCLCTGRAIALQSHGGAEMSYTHQCTSVETITSMALSRSRDFLVAAISSSDTLKDASKWKIASGDILRTEQLQALIQGTTSETAGPSRSEDPNSLLAFSLAEEGHFCLLKVFNLEKEGNAKTIVIPQPPAASKENLGIAGWSYSSSQVENLCWGADHRHLLALVKIHTFKFSPRLSTVSSKPRKSKREELEEGRRRSSLLSSISESGGVGQREFNVDRTETMQLMMIRWEDAKILGKKEIVGNWKDESQPLEITSIVCCPPLRMFDVEADGQPSDSTRSKGSVLYFTLCGPLYLRIWEFSCAQAAVALASGVNDGSALREHDALVQTIYERKNFVDHVWLTVQPQEATGLSPRRVCVGLCLEGEFVYIDAGPASAGKGGEKDEKEVAVVQTTNCLEFLPSNYMVSEFSFNAIVEWRAGFIIGGDFGFLGIFGTYYAGKHSRDWQASRGHAIHCLGVYWLPNARCSIQHLSCVTPSVLMAAAGKKKRADPLAPPVEIDEEDGTLWILATMPAVKDQDTAGIVAADTCANTGGGGLDPEVMVSEMHPNDFQDKLGLSAARPRLLVEEDEKVEKARFASVSKDASSKMIFDIFSFPLTLAGDAHAIWVAEVEPQGAPLQQINPFTRLWTKGCHAAAVSRVSCAHHKSLGISISSDFTLKLFSYRQQVVPKHLQSPQDCQRLSKPEYQEELSFFFSGYQMPLWADVHPHALQVCIYLITSIWFPFDQFGESIVVRPAFEMPLKNPSTVCYSSSGDLLALTQGTAVQLLDPWTTSILTTFTAHLAPVAQVIFSLDDRMLFSCATDGCVYGWRAVVGGSRALEWVDKSSGGYMKLCHDQGRSLLVALPLTADYLLVLHGDQLSGDTFSGLFTKVCDITLPVQSPQVPMSFTCIALSVGLDLLVAGLTDGNCVLFSWPPKHHSLQESTDLGESSLSLFNFSHLEGQHVQSVSVLALVALHTSPITSLCFSAGHNLLVSGCLSGVIQFSQVLTAHPSSTLKDSSHGTDRGDHPADCADLVYELSPVPKDLAKQKFSRLRHSSSSSQSTCLPMQASQDMEVLDEFVFILRSHLSDKLQEVSELQERMQNIKSETEYSLAQKDIEVSDKLRKIQEEKNAAMVDAHRRYDELVEKLSSLEQEMSEQQSSMQIELEKSLTQVEEAYSLKMKLQMDTQKRLEAELANLNDKHTQEKMLLRRELDEKIANLRKNQEKAMTEWKSEYDKVCDLLKSDGLKFEEALKQQEAEYEAEISRLQRLQSRALQAESEKSTSALKDAVSMKQSLSLLQEQLKVKDDELGHSKARVQVTTLLKTLLREVQPLQELSVQIDDAVSMFQRVSEQLDQQRHIIKEKDSSLATLRQSHKHLESFRYVLFHKVKALENERGPLDKQVESLRDSVKEMYGEFMREFKIKQELQQRYDDKGAKADSMVIENKVLRAKLTRVLKDSKRLVADLQEMLHSTVTGQGEGQGKVGPLLQALTGFILRWNKRISKCEKHIQSQEFLDSDRESGDEQQGESMLVSTVQLPQITEEVIRHRTVLLRKAKAVADANVQIQKERTADHRKLTSENSMLIMELNSLRAEKKALERRVRDQQNAMDVMRRTALLPQNQNGTLTPANKSSGQSQRTPFLRRKKGEELEKQIRSHGPLPPLGKTGKEEEGAPVGAKYRKALDEVDSSRQDLERQGFKLSKLTAAMQEELQKHTGAAEGNSKRGGDDHH